MSAMGGLLAAIGGGATAAGKEMSAMAERDEKARMAKLMQDFELVKMERADALAKGQIDYKEGKVDEKRAKRTGMIAEMAGPGATPEQLARAANEYDGDYSASHKMGVDADKTKYDREKDTRDFALREKQANAAISQAAASAADRASSKADKEALKEEYANLAHYLTSKAQNKEGDYSAQIASAASRIAALGGNPQTMIDIMMGKETSVEVTRKKEDMMTGESVSEKQMVKGPRVGGATDVGRPAWKNQPGAAVGRPWEKYQK